MKKHGKVSAFDRSRFIKLDSSITEAYVELRIATLLVALDKIDINGKQFMSLEDVSMRFPDLLSNIDGDCLQHIGNLLTRYNKLVKRLENFEEKILS